MGDPLRRSIVVAALSLAALAGGTGTPASESDPPRRPKIGLVLAGGGARGAAHVGVLKVLEELRIPVDYIAGTSMGSIVGGIYVAGYSPAEIERSFLKVDWPEALNDAPQRQNISFRQKEDDREALMKIELGLDSHGMHRPEGLIAGSKINFILRALTIHVGDIKDFDSLGIPYRAVATDLATGDAVILDHGNLADAMRASMAVPGVFTPVEIDGRDLVDGGLAMNLPIDVVRNMGADLIIAIDVGTPPKAMKENLTAVGVLGRTMSLLSERNVIEQRATLGDRDLLITPDLEGITSASFDKLGPAMVRGEAAARAATESLRRYSVSEEVYAPLLARQRSFGPKGPGTTTVREVEVTGLQRIDPRTVRSRLRLRPGDTLDRKSLANELARVNQIGEFERVDFTLQPVEDGSNLDIFAREKSWGPGFLRLGLNLRSDLEGSGDFALLANYRRTLINRLGAEWKTIARVGDVDSVFTEFYQPLQYSGFLFVAPYAQWQRDKDDFFLPNGNLAPLDVRQRQAGLDLGVQFRNWGEIRAGALRGDLDVEDLSGAAGSFPQVQLGAWRGRLTLDQLDNAYFPRHGGRLQTNLLLSRDGLGADVVYDKADLHAVQAWSAGKNTIVGAVELGTNFGTQIPFYDQFRLGGFFRLSGVPLNQLQGQALGLASVSYYRQIAKLPSVLGGGIYIGGGIEAGNVWDGPGEASFTDLERSGLVFVGAETLLGPIYFGYGRGRDTDSLYFVLGRVF